MTPRELLQSHGPRESMEVDVVIVGAGVAGLSCAIRMQQQAQSKGQTLSIVVLEKGSEPGAHVLSGAVIDPRAMDELFPDWRNSDAPMGAEVTSEDVLMLTEQGHQTIPHALLPRNFDNHGCRVVSLSDLTRWLASQAESLGVEIFPGFAASEVLYNEAGQVMGVATGHMGLGKDGQATDQFQLGMELLAKYTVFAEGTRGHLGKQVIERFDLTQGKDPSSYAIGIKELWQVTPDKADPGRVVHTGGWPMPKDVFGGGFLYHLPNGLVTLGFVVGLDYANPWMSPFEEMQRWKQHPVIRQVLEGGKRIGYGARAINNGTPQAMPKLVFPGGALIGCEAGFMNAARIKGTHTAMKSGMLCADALVEALAQDRAHDVLEAYPQNYQNSWLAQELDQYRNFKLWFKKGPLLGQLMTGIEHWLMPKLGMKRPWWTLHRKQADHLYLKPAQQMPVIDYPKPDGVISFDRLSSVYLSNVNHEENQPSHLTLKNEEVPVNVNWNSYAGPEQRYCPAGVYEYVKDESSTSHRLVINAANCVHCKTCDIKDPTQNIVWVTPEGGGGPNYTGM